MKGKKLATVVIIGLFLSVSLKPALAKKKLKRQVRVKTKINQYGAWVKPKLRRDRHALLLMLGGMQYADKVNYSLTYNAGPVAQGVQSSHKPEDGNTQKEIVFGTCSGNDCVYHGNINEMKLEVRIGLKDGRTLVKRYQINP